MGGGGDKWKVAFFQQRCTTQSHVRQAVALGGFRHPNVAPPVVAGQPD